MCDLLLTSRPFRFKKFKKSSKKWPGKRWFGGHRRYWQEVIAFDRWVQPARRDSRLTGSNPVGNVTLLVLKSTPFLFLMSGKSIYKNRNERCDRLATHVFLFSAKNRIYKQNTHTQSGAENSLSQFWLTITKAFSPFYLEETKSQHLRSLWSPLVS